MLYDASRVLCNKYGYVFALAVFPQPYKCLLLSKLLLM